MADGNNKKNYIAYLDDSEGISNKGNLYSVIAAVLIRQESLNKVINESNRIWNKYLPSIPFTEFHSSELENATKWPFSTLRNDQPLNAKGIY